MVGMLKEEIKKKKFNLCNVTISKLMINKL